MQEPVMESDANIRLWLIQEADDPEIDNEFGLHLGLTGKPMCHGVDEVEYLNRIRKPTEVGEVLETSVDAHELELELRVVENTEDVEGPACIVALPNTSGIAAHRSRKP